ncbi:twin-arginine translocase TatA/TatE family subunit [Akkermansiaceae bacterium]|nr:twin-arginine translocase TatA/TatE family subunit [Akkermansiaceae bacterium]
MGPIGMPELIMIFVVVLLLFGAKKLPELARGVGKSMGEFKKAREEFEREITRSEDEVRREDKPKDTRVKPAADKETHDA